MSRLSLLAPWPLLLVAALSSSCEERRPPRPPPPPSTQGLPAALAPPLDPGLPPGDEVVLVMSRCVICHTQQYLVQQRLTEAQWQKTVAKMQKWGAPLTDAEAAALVPYLAKHFSPTAPEPTLALVDKPE